MIINFANGFSRTKPPHLLSEGQCQKLQNFYCKDGAIKKVGGTTAYNSTSMGDLGIPFVLRSYHIRADGERVKRTHAYYDGALYYGDDLTGQLTVVDNAQGLSKKTFPTHFTMQIGGNSVAFVLTGKDKVYKYDGNASYIWDICGGDLSNIFDYESGVVHLDRAWYIVRGSSQIDYSESLNPEAIADTVTIGQDKDSFCVRFVEGAGETLYVFKNNSIYQLYGRTPSQFQWRKITDKYGLSAKRAIHPVGGGFVFHNTYDRELYFFAGTEAGIQPLTEEDIRLREIMELSDDALNNACMTVHNGFFRFAFQHVDSSIDANDCELVYNIFDPRGNLPKWSLIKGTNVWSYSVWDKYGDNQELVTGRSDIGKLMYHNRGHDFDGNAIETIVRTAEVTLSEDKAVRLKDFFIKGKPYSYNTTSLFRYFLNGRFTDRGEESLSFRGETRDVGAIHVLTQSLFNDRIIPLTNYSRGNSISFEIYDFNNATDLEIYSIAIKARERYKIRNQKI